MHVDGYPIKGLFAAGECTGGVHGGDRLGSCATLDCIAFGRIAGHNIATFKGNDETISSLSQNDAIRQPVMA